MVRTAARDFAETKDLFVCNSGLFDFAHASLVLEGEALPDVKAEDLVWQRKEAQERGDTFQVLNAGKMTIRKNNK